MGEVKYIRFGLFSVRLFHPPSLFEQDISKRRISTLHNAIMSQPVIKSKRVTWRIGNCKELGKTNSVYFRIGRDKRRNVGVVRYLGDDVSVDVGQAPVEFDEETHDEYPSTHVVLNPEHNICAIAYHPDLAKDLSALGNRLRQLIAASKEIKESQFKIDVDLVRDPDSFVKQIEESFAVQRISLWIKEPNPFNVEKDIVRPLQKSVSNLSGKKARMSVTGDELNKEKVIEVARSAASLGDGAEATLVEEEGGTRRVSLGKETVEFNVPVEQDKELDPVLVEEWILREQRKIRGEQ